MDNILTIRQLNQKLKQVLDVKFPFVWVKGEVTNLARPSSGHIYFSLKDGDDLLNCVWFRTQQEEQAFDPLTGEVWEDGPKPSIALSVQDGQELICAGRLTIYAPRGQYQLVVELAQETGIGQLYANFEALKKKLSSEGLFDSKYKKALPHNIRNVALITAKTGAVIQDFLRISHNRGISATIHIYPSLVQGEGAPTMLINSLIKAQEDTFTKKICSHDMKSSKIIHEKADVIVFIRGGGSIQDLWAFNDENLARAIHACQIPVLTGIGHEPDFTIADYVADMSMATPSHVAQILWQERSSIMQKVDDKERLLTELIENIVYNYANILQNECKKLHLLSPKNKLAQKEENLYNLYMRMKNTFLRHLTFEEMQIKNLTQHIKNFKPALTKEEISLEYHKNLLTKAALAKLHEKSIQFEHVETKFLSLLKDFPENFSKKIEQIHLQLEIHSPLAPLKKGYALVEKTTSTGEKNVLRSTKNVKTNDTLYLTFIDGNVETVATNVKINKQ